MKRIVFAIVLSFAGRAFAHGDGGPGPHGGSIQMPGGFHTELKINGRTARVYLLDMSFANPTVKDSSVDWRSGKAKGACTAARDYFECQLPKAVNLRKGELRILATREGQKGNEAVYRLPLGGQASAPAGKMHHEGGH